jgi:arabinan endo-1,5-alpha-L-arabinosidase
MYYCAGGDRHRAYKIHLATSNDLWHWQRHEANPMVVDGFDARDPMVLRLRDRWIMYYTATSEPIGGFHTVVAVTSTDLVNWGAAKRFLYIRNKANMVAQLNHLSHGSLNIR